ncbi:MAG: hypothetical protein ABFE07_07000 [Armatimonadia bacterium]
MSLTITDLAASNVITNQEPASGASATSSEIDLEEKTDCSALQIFTKCGGFAGTPAGTVTVQVLGSHTSGGDTFSREQFVHTVVANQTHYWCDVVLAPCRYMKIVVTNNSGQNISADCLNVWVEARRVTA